MKISKFFTIITIVLFMCCSCTKGESDLKIRISPSDKNIVDLVSQIYDDLHLMEIVKFNGSINELNDQYPIECLRKINDIYKVIYLGDNKVAVFHFDNMGYKISSDIYSMQVLRSDFDRLTKGHFLDDVKKIDPDGKYVFLYTGRNDIPKVSSHYTKDGYLITIEYDVSNVILNINEELV